MPVTFDVG